MAILNYSLTVCQRLVVDNSFREEVLRLLIGLYERVEKPDWVTIAQCLMFLDDAPEVSKILDGLLKGSEDDALLAFQIGFDLFENEMQSFLLKVRGWGGWGWGGGLGREGGPCGGACVSVHGCRRPASC